MKELTIEEKAQRYDETIERAKKWRNAPNADKIPTYASRVVNEIFPELAESENERIRKHIISVLEDCWQTCKNIDYDSSRIQEDIAWLKKQHDPQVTDAEMKEVLRTEYEKGRADTIAKMQKEWSEEDELSLKQAIYVCHQDAYTAVENWLKSLKQRIGG